MFTKPDKNRGPFPQTKTAWRLRFSGFLAVIAMVMTMIAIPAAFSQSDKVLEYPNMDFGVRFTQGKAALSLQNAQANFESSKSDDDIYRLFFAYFRAHKHIEARKLAEDCLKRNEHKPVAMLFLGQLTEFELDDDEALATYDKILTAYPRFVNALLVRGEYYRGHGQSDKAINDFNEAFKYAGKPMQYEILYHQGKLLLQKKDYQGALAIYNKRIKLQPDDLANYEWRLSVEAKLGKWKDALADAKMAESKQRLKPVQLIDKISALYALGKYEDVITTVNSYTRDMTKSLFCLPEHRQAVLIRMHSYEKLGRKQEAAADRAALNKADSDAYRDSLFRSKP